MELYRYIVKDVSLFNSYKDTELRIAEIVKSPMGSSVGQNVLVHQNKLVYVRNHHSLYAVDPGDVIAIGTNEELYELFKSLWDLKVTNWNSK